MEVAIVVILMEVITPLFIHSGVCLTHSRPPSLAEQSCDGERLQRAERGGCAD